MSASESTFRDLVHTLYSDHHGWLYAWLRRKLRCPSSAADVAQDTFVRVIASRDPALLDVREPRAYLTTTARRLMIDRSRRQRIEEAYLAMLAAGQDATRASASAEETFAVIELVEQIGAALERAPARAREAFLLHYVDGHTHAAIAARLGVSTRMVQNYLVQCLLRCGLAEARHA